MVAVRCDAELLAEAVTEIVPLFDPEAGETLSHVEVPLLTVQLMLEVMENDSCAEADENRKEPGLTVKLEMKPF